MAAAPRHCIKQEDLDYYIKCLALERGCPVEQVNRTKAHWDLIIYKERCMAKVVEYREAGGEYSCSLCGCKFIDRHNRNRHRRNVKCTEQVVELDKTKWECDICGKTLSSRSSRDRHKRTVHKPK